MLSSGAPTSWTVAGRAPGSRVPPHVGRGQQVLRGDTGAVAANMEPMSQGQDQQKPAPRVGWLESRPTDWGPADEEEQLAAPHWVQSFEVASLSIIAGHVADFPSSPKILCPEGFHLAVGSLRVKASTRHWVQHIAGPTDANRMGTVR